MDVLVHDARKKVHITCHDPLGILFPYYSVLNVNVVYALVDLLREVLHVDLLLKYHLAIVSECEVDWLLLPSHEELLLPHVVLLALHSILMVCLPLLLFFLHAVGLAQCHRMSLLIEVLTCQPIRVVYFLLNELFSIQVDGHGLFRYFHVLKRSLGLRTPNHFVEDGGRYGVSPFRGFRKVAVLLLELA